MRNPGRLILAAGAAALLVFWQLFIAYKAGVLYGDFHAFYCAANAVLQGANPYTASALHACESIARPYGLSYAPANVVVPAPQPGYALIAFVPFAAMPYVPACVVWLIVTLLCVALSARALSILLNRPADLMLWTLATGFTVTSIPTGEIGAPLVAALLWMAVALRRGAWVPAALAGGFAMLVPHVALPAMLGAFVLLPRARLPIALAAAALTVLDVLCGGAGTAVAYFTSVLPAHAQAEIGSSMQYGMTWILHALHLSEHAAIAGGELSYALMTLLGIVAAHLLVRRRADAAYAALIPPAFAVAGGTFIHYTQIMIAIPAALLLFDRRALRARAVFAAAFLLLAIPWLWLLGEPSLIIVYAVVSGALAALVLGCDATGSLRVAFGAVLLGGLILAAGYYFGPAYASHAAAHALQGGLAQGSWGEFVRSHWASTGIAWWIAKIPTWSGLLLLTLGCAYVLSKEDFVTPVAVEQVPVAP